MSAHRCSVSIMTATAHEWQFTAVARRWEETVVRKDDRVLLHHHQTLCYRHCTRCGLVQECQAGKPWQAFNAIADDQ